MQTSRSCSLLSYLAATGHKLHLDWVNGFRIKKVWRRQEWCSDQKTLPKPTLYVSNSIYSQNSARLRTLLLSLPHSLIRSHCHQLFRQKPLVPVQIPVPLLLPRLSQMPPLSTAFILGTLLDSSTNQSWIPLQIQRNALAPSIFRHKPTRVLLQVLECGGEKWDVVWMNRSKTGDGGGFSGGWRGFAIDQRLASGDAVVFKKEEGLVLRATIYRRWMSCMQIDNTG